MEMKMNKKDFINALKGKIGYSEEKYVIINDILEDNFFLSKSKKNIIIDELKQRLDINHDEALNVYEVSVDIIKGEIKDQLKHPFRGKE